MEKNFRRFAAPLAACLFLSACGPAARFALRDPQRAPQVKKIAVLPFFNANTLSVEFITEGESKSAFTTDFLKHAKKSLAKRYEFIAEKDVEEALKKTGSYRGWVKEEGRHQRAGFTLSEALKAGEELKADAVILGAGADHENKILKKLYRSTVTVRLIDVRTGKVLWGATALKKGAFDSMPCKKIARLLAREAL